MQGSVSWLLGYYSYSINVTTQESAHATLHNIKKTLGCTALCDAKKTIMLHCAFGHDGAIAQADIAAVGPNSKKPAKNEILKIHEIDWSYLFLQQFDRFWIWCECNHRKRKSCISADTFPKIRETTSSQLIFWRVVAIWNHSARACPG